MIYTMERIQRTFNNMLRNEKVPSFICYLLPFVCLGGFLFNLVLNNRIKPPEGYYLIHYLYTFDHGFVSRGLVGEIISWFFEKVSDDLTQKIVLLFSTFLMIVASLCIGRALNKVKSNMKLFCVVTLICLLISVLPGSFRLYYEDIKLDKVLWAITLLCVLLVRNKFTIWLVPFLCVLATMINPVFLFCSMILISIILLQELYYNNFSKKHAVICFVSYLSMIILGIYALVSEKYLGFSTPEELVNYYFSRYTGEIDIQTLESFKTEWLFDYFDSFDMALKKAFQIYFVEWENGIVTIVDFIFLMIPTYYLMVMFWRSCIRESKTNFQKFIFFLCLISPIVIIPPILFSWETSKYFYNNLIVQLSLIVYFIATNNSATFNPISKVLAWIKKEPIYSAFIALYFSSFIFD